MEKYIIWGAGDLGTQAYWYYKGRGEVLFFIDKNIKRTKESIGEVNIYPIEKIHGHNDKTVVVAMHTQLREGVLEYLKENGFCKVTCFTPEIWRMRTESVLAELNEKRSIDLGEFLKSCGEIKLLLSCIRGSSLLLDYAFLRGVAQRFKCRKYLEIGTYIGDSLQAVADICEECHSLTAKPGSEVSMADFCREADIPDYSGYLADLPNVIHHYCDDSKVYDYTQLPDDIDLYFIDADHTYKGVYWDTRNVFAHRKSNSLVIWHDVHGSTGESEGVVVAIQDALGDEFKNVFCVDNNWCGIYVPESMQENLKLSSRHYNASPDKLCAYEIVLKEKDINRLT